jgi:hypothetical protein
MKDKELVSDCCGADLKGIVSADGLARCPECHEGCCAEENGYHLEEWEREEEEKEVENE